MRLDLFVKLKYESSAIIFVGIRSCWHFGKLWILCLNIF